MCCESDVLKMIGRFSIHFSEHFSNKTEEDVALMAVEWMCFLGTYADFELDQAAYRLIATCERMPKISQVLQELENLRQPEQSSADVQWHNILQAARWFGTETYADGTGGFAEARGMLDEVTAEAARRIGWARICNAPDSELHWVKKEFIETLGAVKQSAYIAEITTNRLNAPTSLNALMSGMAGGAK